MPIGEYIHKSGESSVSWKGDKVGIIGVHGWLKREYGTPKNCEHCGENDESKIYDWACKNTLYRRNRNDFMRLCRSCHRKYDYKHNGLKISEETRIKMSLKSKGNQYARIHEKIKCPSCEIMFFPKFYGTKFCSKSCATKYRYKK